MLEDDGREGCFVVAVGLVGNGLGIVLLKGSLHNLESKKDPRNGGVATGRDTRGGNARQQESVALGFSW